MHQNIIKERAEDAGLSHLIEDVELNTFSWEEYKEITRLLESIRDKKENINRINKIINTKERY